ncbi:TPA: type II secretion system minor pseudopilin GspK [Escherichia coli]
MNGTIPRRGMALVMVLLLLAVMASVCVSLSHRVPSQTEKMRSLQDYQQATWNAVSAESLALSILNENLKNEAYVHPAQSWASGPHVFPLPQGKIAVTLRDAQACFNLNVFAGTTEERRPSAVQHLTTLISRLDIPVRQAERIAESLRTFIGGYREEQMPSGHAESEYLTRPVPFWPANQPLTDISEIRVVQGMDAGLYQKLKPLVCALPENRLQININTLDVAQSVIPEALFAPGLSPVQARALLQHRPGKGWRSVGEFLASPYLKKVDEDTRKQVGELLTVNSNYFRLRTDVTVNETELTMNALIARMGSQHFSVLWHQTGESE